MRMTFASKSTSSHMSPSCSDRPGAHQERRGVVDALVEVVARGGEEPRHLVGREHGLPRLIALALEAPSAWRAAGTRDPRRRAPAPPST